MKKFKLGILVLSFALFSISQIFAIPRKDQDLVSADHWIYDALTSLELEQGRTNFSDQAPLTIQNIKALMSDINYDALSSTGKSQYDRIISYFNEKNWSLNYGHFSAGIEAFMNAEFYGKTNPELDWIYDYHKKQSFLDMPIKLNLDDFVTVFTNFSVRQCKTAMSGNNQFSNQAFTPDTFDPYLTHESYIAAGYKFLDNTGLSFRFGSGQQSIGRSSTGSIIHSTNITDTMYANLSFYSPFFQYAANITQINPLTYFYSHRFDIRFFKKLSFSFLEGVLPYSTMDMRFFAPFGIYHSMGLFNEYNLTSYFAFKINYTPVKYLRIYVLYAQDEHQLANEGPVGGVIVPEGTGFQAGLESSIPFKKGYFHLNGEFYYSNPYLYVKESPNWTFVKTSSEMVSDSSNFYEWSGSPFGPDSMAAKASFGYEKIDSWSLTLTYVWAAKGEFSGTNPFKTLNWTSSNYNADLKNWIYPTNNASYADGSTYKTPHGCPEYVNQVYITGTYKVNKWLSFKAQGAYTFVSNFNHKEGDFKHGLEGVISAKVNFTQIAKKELNSDFMLTDGK